jgi:hypothetical protein
MSCFSGPNVIEDGLVMSLDAANPKSYDSRENLLTHSEADSSTWSEKTSNTTFTNLNLNALGLFKGVEVTSSTGENWHRLGSGFVVSLVNGRTYTLSFWYRAGTTGRARLQIRSDGQESLVEGPVNGSNWTIIQNVGAVSDVTTTLLEDGLTYKTSYTLVSNRSATASIAIGIGLNDFVPGKTVIALGAQIEKDSVTSQYTKTTGTAITRPSGWIDLTGRNNATSSSSLSISTESPGTVIRLDNTNAIQVTFSQPINKYLFTLSYWGRGTAVPPSDYRRIWRLVEPNAPHGYYFIADTREVATPSLLHYVKDYSTNNWDVRTMISQSDFLNFQWNHYTLVVLAENNWRSYRNGVFLGTNTTPTQDLSSYGNITRLDIGGVNTNFNISNVSMYDRALSDSEILQNFNSARTRFGL